MKKKILWKTLWWKSHEKKWKIREGIRKVVLQFKNSRFNIKEVIGHLVRNVFVLTGKEEESKDLEKREAICWRKIPK